MILTGMKIEGYKNISFVELVPDAHMNLVSGKNGAGKSSLIEAMIDAIKGKTEMGKRPQRKIQRGKEKAVIEVTLGEGDEALKIKRTITQKDVYLKAERADGKPVSQTDLDNLLDSSTINITKLLFMSPKDQVDFIKRIAGIDTSEVESIYKELYAERTVLNRALKEAEGALSSIGEVEEVARVSVSSIMDEIKKAEESNRIGVDRDNELAHIEMEASALDDKMGTARERIEYYNQAILQLEEEIKSNEKEYEKMSAEVAKLAAKKVPKKIDIEPFKKKIDDAERINADAQKYDSYLSAKDAVAKAKKNTDSVNKKMSDALAEREKIIKDSRLPFKNVEFDKDLGLIIGGIAFNDMSTAQQIRVMSRIYIESKPELQVIYIKDGSLLDPETLSQISEMSELKDYQFLVEVVDEVDGSIIMREGSIYNEEESGAEKQEEKQEKL